MMTDIELRVRGLLAEVYTPLGVNVWLGARNRNLGGAVPRELLDSGSQLAALEVLAEAEGVAGAS